MTRSTYLLVAGSAALSLLTAAPVIAQSADSARTSPPRPAMRDGMGPQRQFGPRFGPDDNRRDARFGREGFRGPQSRGDRFGGERFGGERFRGDRRGSGAPGMRAGWLGGDGPRGLMRGIALSTDQQKALRSTQARHLLSTKPLLLEMVSARTDEQLARLNGDQKALDAASARLTTTGAKLDSLRSLRTPTDDLRVVLTPDQQKVLDRNLTEAATRRGGPTGPVGPGARGRRGPGGDGEGASPDQLDDVR